MDKIKQVLTGHSSKTDSTSHATETTGTFVSTIGRGVRNLRQSLTSLPIAFYRRQRKVMA